jgi:hypothetical protein
MNPTAKGRSEGKVLRFGCYKSESVPGETQSYLATQPRECKPVTPSTGFPCLDWRTVKVQGRPDFENLNQAVRRIHFPTETARHLERETGRKGWRQGDLFAWNKPTCNTVVTVPEESRQRAKKP